jgi:hypothetical protein
MKDDEVGRAGRAECPSEFGSTRPLPLSDLPQLSLTELRAEWRRLFRASPPLLSRDLVIRSLAYRMQEHNLGGLTKATQRRLRALQQAFATQGEISVSVAPAIKAGSRLVREWHGRTHIVTVTEVGFEYSGQSYPSLTQIAQLITGAHWSGPRFFGLVRPAPQVKESCPTGHPAVRKRQSLNLSTGSGLQGQQA